MRESLGKNFWARKIYIGNAVLRQWLRFRIGTSKSFIAGLQQNSLKNKTVNSATTFNQEKTIRPTRISVSVATLDSDIEKNTNWQSVHSAPINNEKYLFCENPVRTGF